MEIKVYPGEADFLLLKTEHPLYEKVIKGKNSDPGLQQLQRIK